MSDENKTEKPTPKRRQQAREEGQVARSQDLSGAVGLAAGFALLLLTGPRFWDACAGMMQETFVAIGDPSIVTQQGLGRLLASGALAVATASAPLMFACLLAGVLINVLQVGWKPSAKAMKPRPSKLNPLKGAKQIFGPHGLVEGGKSLVKVAAVGGIVAVIVFPRMNELAALVGIPPAVLGAELIRHIKDIAIWAIAAYFVIGIADFFYQRYRTEKQLKMSRDEVKREAKDQDLPPEVRGHIKRKQREQSRARMMGAVATADVVVTNPTHYAVALKYEKGMAAPVCVAKGVDSLALRIRAVATEHGVPIVPDPPLARSLHRAVEIGQQIPEDLFQAVAQVLAYVYRQAGRRRAA
jgi:flagellar biosynthesis protein FlhB